MTPPRAPTVAPATAVVDLATAASAFMPSGDVLYLDCAAQSPRLRAAHAAGLAALGAGGRPWQASSESPETRLESLRGAIASLLDDDGGAVAAVPSASYGLATAARNLPLDAGDVVLVLEGQFPSNLLPWQQRCAEREARVVGVRRGAGEDWTDAVLAALEAGPAPRIAALPQVRWDDGARLDLDRIAPRVHASGAALVLDLSQSLGALPADLERWRPDFAVAVGYKWLLGPLGLAWLWSAPRWRERGIAIEQHWSARDAGEGWRFPVDVVRPHHAGARRFDAGGLDDPVRLAMADAGLAQVHAWGVPAIASALGERTHSLDAALDAHGLAQWKTPGHAPHITALRPPAERVEAVFAAFRRERIVCTRRYGLLRIAPHLHVGVEDMARVAAIAAAA